MSTIRIFPTASATTPDELYQIVHPIMPTDSEAWFGSCYAEWEVEGGFYRNLDGAPGEPRVAIVVLPVSLLADLGFEFELEVDEPEDGEDGFHAISLATACGWEILD